MRQILLFSLLWITQACSKQVDAVEAFPQYSEEETVEEGKTGTDGGVTIQEYHSSTRFDSSFYISASFEWDPQTQNNREYGYLFVGNTILTPNSGGSYLTHLNNQRENLFGHMVDITLYDTEQQIHFTKPFYIPRFFQKTNIVGDTLEEGTPIHWKPDPRSLPYLELRLRTLDYTPTSDKYVENILFIPNTGSYYIRKQLMKGFAKKALATLVIRQFNFDYVTVDDEDGIRRVYSLKAWSQEDQAVYIR